MDHSAKQPEPISPCIGDCNLVQSKTHCRGCLRLLDEIAGWSGFSIARKQSVIVACLQRRLVLDGSGQLVVASQPASGEPQSPVS